MFKSLQQPLHKPANPLDQRSHHTPPGPRRHHEEEEEEASKQTTWLVGTPGDAQADYRNSLRVTDTQRDGKLGLRSPPMGR